MEDLKEFEFIVVRKSYTFATCPACDGSGVKKRTFRKMVFVEDCHECFGEGRRRFSKEEEYSLSEALKELQSI